MRNTNKFDEIINKIIIRYKKYLETRQRRLKKFWQTTKSPKTCPIVNIFEWSVSNVIKMGTVKTIDARSCVMCLFRMFKTFYENIQTQNVSIVPWNDASWFLLELINRISVRRKSMNVSDIFFNGTTEFLTV